MNLHAQDGLNASYFLSGPVYNTHSAKFLNDSAQYAWGKSVRESALGTQAVKDMSWELESYLSFFSDIIGIEISEKSTPNIYTLLDYGFRYARNSVETSQSTNFFLRPYVYYEEASLIPESDETYQETSSYPSAQATLGWTLGMLLSEACPEKQDAILKRAYEIGTSSVIAGYSWQSDTGSWHRMNMRKRRPAPGPMNPISMPTTCPTPRNTSRIRPRRVLPSTTMMSPPTMTVSPSVERPVAIWP